VAHELIEIQDVMTRPFLACLVDLKRGEEEIQVSSQPCFCRIPAVNNLMEEAIIMNNIFPNNNITDPSTRQL
jgi:hypothetical protein